MRKPSILLTVASLGAVVGLTGCIDDNYDLSNVDTTTELKVVDLTLPVNIDDITLSDVLNLNDGSNLKVIDGKYVFIADGEIHSNSLNIKNITVVPEKPSITRDVIFPSAGAGETMTFDIASSPAEYNYHDDNVDPNVLELTKLACNLEVSVKVYIEEMLAAGPAADYSNVRVKLPKHLTMITDKGTYDPETGILVIESAHTDNGVITVNAKITEILVNEDGGAAKFEYSASGSRFSFTDEVHVIEGKVTFSRSAFPSEVSQMTLVTAYDFGTMTVDRIWGEVKYAISGFNIDPVRLNGIPGLINGPMTNISIVNPQIYLQIDNPVYDAGLVPQCGMSLTALRYGGDNHTESIAPFLLDGPDELSSYVLSPSVPATYAEGFDNPKWYEFEGLGDILSGMGIPHSIEVKVVEPQFAPQEIGVNGLQLGNIPGVKGKYQFYAPLVLGEGSMVVYSDTEDGWNDEDIDKLIIDRLAIDAEVTNNTQFDILFGGYPLVVGGKPAPGVTFRSTVVKAGQTQPVTIYTEGEKIEHLDGVYITAVLASDVTNELEPTDNVVLRDVRVNVTASYITEL